MTYNPPALLIEQALPQIEAKANEILERLSDGNMSVRFQTQRELKTSDNLKETLDIIISDNAGTRVQIGRQGRRSDNDVSQ